MTAFKTASQGEWAKFIYSVVDDVNAKAGEVREGVSFLRYEQKKIMKDIIIKINIILYLRKYFSF